MTPEKQAERRREIETAAYAVLRDVGYKSATLPLIAQRAKTSNETLYRWYGGKAGLFAEMVKANALVVREALAAPQQRADDPVAALGSVAQVLLTMLVGERAILLNRAAAADASESGTLGPLLAQHGRKAVAPLLSELIERFAPADARAAAETFINLLVGDWQVRLVTGAMAPPSAEAISQRADTALTQFCLLFSPR